ncbi:hypothetical protein FCIRC_5128 [Fusarium circinatum]|uniref:Uncharacterized protein n=1 Tax=Fusarium circinatum TaxID=48490 RepID=A0A8H5U1D9_FUSCI|nr:hypothetical protein FCIRC_5128 [Fusarium circinatum]
MPSDEITEKHLSVSVDGHCEYIARAALRLDRRVSQSIPPWHSENREVDVLSLASSNNIGWKMKTVKGDTIPKLRRIPDSCIKWVKPEHLEAAKQEYNKQENHEQDHLAPIDQWPDDPIQSIIHAHMHGYLIVCERGRDPDDDFFHPELYSSLTTTMDKTAFEAFSKMDLQENGPEIEDPAINRLWRSHENGKTRYVAWFMKLRMTTLSLPSTPMVPKYNTISMLLNDRSPPIVQKTSLEDLLIAMERAKIERVDPAKLRPDRSKFKSDQSVIEMTDYTKLQFVIQQHIDGDAIFELITYEKEPGPATKKNPVELLQAVVVFQVKIITKSPFRLRLNTINYPKVPILKYPKLTQVFTTYGRTREQRIGRVARLQGFRYNVQVELSPSFVHPRSTWEILQSNLTGLGKNLNKPIQIAVYAFYMAQVKLLDHELNDLVLNGILTAEERHQIETSSLDSAQGRR